jgi:hypothetical protein
LKAACSGRLATPHPKQYNPDSLSPKANNDSMTMRVTSPHDTVDVATTIQQQLHQNAIPSRKTNLAPHRRPILPA